MIRPISGGIAEYDALVAQMKTNSDLLDSFITYLAGVAAIIDKGVASAKTLEDLKASMTGLSTDLKTKDDAAAAALVAATPAAGASG